MKTTLLSSLLLIIWVTQSYAQTCTVELTRDTFICGFSYNLQASPIGGEWDAICDSSAAVVDFFSINDSLTSVTVSQCGDFTFVYTFLDTMTNAVFDTVSLDPLTIDTLLILDTLCMDRDTLFLGFSNPNSAEYNLFISVEASYPESSCIPNDTINCENSFGLTDPEQPLMAWEIITAGSCSSTILDIEVQDQTDCKAEAILFQSSSFFSVVTDTLVVFANAFVEVGDNGQVIGNPYQEALNQATDHMIGKTSELCPLPEFCDNTPLWCLDTLLDTTQVIVPIRVGGEWLFHPSEDKVVVLSDTTEFIRDDSTFLLIAQPNANVLEAQLEVFQINYLGDTIPVINPGPIKLEWKENWEIDTLTQISSHLVDTCCGGGLVINTEVVNPPEPPNYDCPPFTTVFLEALGYSASIESCSDSSYIVKIITRGGNPPYIIDGLTGNLSDSVFYSDPISIMDTYQVLISDQDSCQVDLSGDACRCVDVQANIEPEVILKCEDACVELIVNGISSIGDSFSYEWVNSDGQTIGVGPEVEVCDTGAYAITVKELNSACSISRLINVIQPMPLADMGTDTMLTCINPEIILGGDDLSTGPSIVYHWSGPGIDSLATHLAQPIVELTGRYQLIIIDTLSNCRDSGEINIEKDFYYPIADAGPDDTLNCTATALFIGGINTSSGDSITLSWSGAIPNNQTNIRHPFVQVPGIYTLRVTNNNNGCMDEDTMELFSYQGIFVDLETSPSCWNKDSGRVIIESTQGGQRPYAYSLDDFFYKPGPQLNNISPGEKTLFVKDVFGCKESINIFIDEISPIGTFEIDEEFHFCGEGEITLDLFTSTNLDTIIYEWSDGSITPFNTLSEPGNYWVEYRSSCESFRHEFSIIDDLDLGSKFAIPNVFSPDGDGVNDTFKPLTTLELADYELVVYNRWGKKIFQSNIPEEGWDGTINAKASPSDVYIWTLKGRILFCDIGEDLLFRRGDVTLLR